MTVEEELSFQVVGFTFLDKYGGNHVSVFSYGT